MVVGTSHVPIVVIPWADIPHPREDQHLPLQGQGAVARAHRRGRSAVPRETVRSHSPICHPARPVRASCFGPTVDELRMSPLRAVCLALAAVLVAACAGGGAAPVTTVEQTASPTPEATPAPTTEAVTTATVQPSATPAPRWDELPVAANDAASLAKQLVMVEAALRDPNVSGAQLAWTGHLQQLAYSRLADYPDWKDTVLGALPVSTRSAVLGSPGAGQQLRPIGGPLPKTLPGWEVAG